MDYLDAAIDLYLAEITNQIMNDDKVWVYTPFECAANWLLEKTGSSQAVDALEEAITLI